jgi:hypothetical protein
MEITYKSTDYIGPERNAEDILVDALSKLSPKDIIKSTVIDRVPLPLRSGFANPEVGIRAFFQ